MVRQHDATGTDADRFGPAGNVAYANRSGGAGDAGKVVVFRQPEPLKASIFSVLCQVERIGQCIGWGEAFTNVGEVDCESNERCVAEVLEAVEFLLQTCPPFAVGEVRQDPDTGVCWVSYYNTASGGLSTEDPYVYFPDRSQFLIHGQSTYYYESGAIQSTWHWVEGIVEGDYIRFDVTSLPSGGSIGKFGIYLISEAS